MYTKMVNGQQPCHKYVFVSNTLNSQKQLVTSKNQIKKKSCIYGEHTMEAY